MRQRTLKPGFFTNEDLCALPPLTRLLFAGLWLLADRAGRFEDRPARIKAQVFPYEPDLDIASMLLALELHGFVQRYEVSGIRYGWLPTFVKNQNPHPKETASVIPAAVELHGRQHASRVKVMPSNADTYTSGSSGSSIPSGSSDISVPCNAPVTVPSVTATDIHDDNGQDAEIDAEELQLMKNLVALQDSGQDPQSVCDSLPRPAGQAAFGAHRALVGGKSGIPRSPGGLTVRRRLNDALEARQRAQDAPILSDNNRRTFEAADRVGARLIAQRDGKSVPREIEG